MLFLDMTDDHINVMLVLQSCTDSLQVMADSSAETFPTASDGTYDVGNIQDVTADSSAETFPTASDGTYDVGSIRDEDRDMQEEGAVNVQTEKVIVSEEEECRDIKDEEGMYSEEEEKEDIDTK